MESGSEGRGLEARRSAGGELRWAPLLAGLLAVVFLAQALLISGQKAAAYDEPFHIATGLMYVETGRVVRSQDHPPLLRELSGLVMHWAGIRLPRTPEVAAVEQRGQGGNLEYGIGNQVLGMYGPDRVLYWARLPLLLLGAVFVWSIYWFGRELVGEGAGLAAAFLCAFDPLLLSNFGMVYTDGGMALFAMLTILALWAYVRRPSWLRLLWCGLALGAALGAKLTAVILVPSVAVLLLAAKLWPLPTVEATGGESRLARNYWVAFAGICVVAMSALLYIFLWPANPMFYIRELQEVDRSHATNYLYFLHGEYAKHFYRYYVEAWLLKEPLAIVGLTGWGAVVLARSRQAPRLACMFLLVPGAASLVLYSLFSDHLGVRYVLPVVPFAMVAAGAGLAALWRGPQPWKRALGAGLSVWVLVAAMGIYPDQMSYFNEAACALDKPSQMGLDGGTRCGTDWLDDSNVDAGGDALKQLRAWLSEHAAGQRVYLGYMGSTPPAYYGIAQRPTDYMTVLQGMQPGLYAVSAHIVARAHPGAGSNGAAWLLQRKPIAFVGHTYFIYQVP